MQWESANVNLLQGSVRPPSDKSLTHRAYMFAAAATSPSEIRRPLQSEDCQSTLRCLEQMGVQTEIVSRDVVRLTPSANWHEPTDDLDCGNSGTTMRLLSGLIASRPLRARLIGDESLSRRPMKRIIDPLSQMGARIDGDTAPLTIHGGQLTGIRYEMPVASAQVKSCTLLAGLKASGETWVREPEPTRDHTERMLRGLGIEVMREEGWIGVRGGATWSGFDFTAPGDISSAAFWVVAAAIVPGSEITLNGIGVNPSRTGILDVIEQCRIRWEHGEPGETMGEPVADITIFHTTDREPFVIEGALVPRLIDEIPVLCVLATQCPGLSVIRGAAELKHKESDRIQKMADGLRAMGANIEVRDDGMEILGPTPLKATRIDAHGDHRIAMSFAVAGLIAEGKTIIDGAESIATSYPNFDRDLGALATH